MSLRKAERKKMKVPILLMGASGSGKTVSALMIAKGLTEGMFPDLSEDERWGKVAVIDTEHARSELYANQTIADNHIGQFNIYDLEPPHSPQRYAEAFRECKEAGCEVIIIDSITHAWSGQGGLLDKVNSYGGKFSDWNKVKPDEQAFLKIFSDQDVHVIATVRSKQGYEVSQSDTGKLNVTKLGLKPDQRDGLEYEFAIAFQLYPNHMAEASKDNSNHFEERIVISPGTGLEIYKWAEQGVDLKAQKKKERAEKIDKIKELANESEERQGMLESIIQAMNKDLEEFPDIALDKAINKLNEIEIKTAEDKENK